MVTAALCLNGTVLEEAAEITAHDFLGKQVDLNGIRNIDITTHGEEEVDGCEQLTGHDELNHDDL